MPSKQFQQHKDKEICFFIFPKKREPNVPISPVATQLQGR